MKKSILATLLAFIAITASILTGAYAATVTALDANTAYVTDDLGKSAQYSGQQLNQIVTQSGVQEARISQQAQMADETYVQWAHTQQVFQGEVQSNSFNSATTL